MAVTPLLRSFLSAMRQLSGAECVSIYVPAAHFHDLGPFLVHDGEVEPIPEMAAEKLAEAFVRGAADSQLDAELDARLFESESPHSFVLRLPSLWQLDAAAALRDGTHPLRRCSDQRRAHLPAIWFGLRFADNGFPFPLDSGAVPIASRFSPPTADSGWWLRLFALAGEMSRSLLEMQQVLSDPVTGLPGRLELHSRLAYTLETAHVQQIPTSLLFVSPDGFGTVNERFGREAGDEVMQRISARLLDALRDTDFVARYGGAIFACLLDGARPEGAQTAADKLLGRLSGDPYLDGSLGLGFSIGMASIDPTVDHVDKELDLLQRADQALHQAKRSGGGRVVVWLADEEDSRFVQPNELSGVFTGNMAKDYRNMILLSETMAVVAASSTLDDLRSCLVETLCSTMTADRVALFDLAEEEPTCVRSYARGQGRLPADAERALIEAARPLVGQAGDNQRFVNGSVPAEGFSAYAIPLIVAGDCVGCFYMDGKGESLRLDSYDLAFFRSFAAQVAAALDRARLTEQERAREDAERQRLHSELDQLRQALQQAKLEYRSDQMESLLATARRVAPTDATVLITGESGTGKELIARTLHQLSPRHQHPLVVVDCGAMPATLIESELFGHERGAYTDAKHRKIGRLEEADGGTVLLDEIGELPLEVQTRLLRFVQERQLTPVGSTRSRSVDVRVLAATNRDLRQEVQAGRFREDLYYRLNVVRLEVPSLRDRPEDILYLAQHFLRTYSLLYRKDVEALDEAAQLCLLDHAWRGNVRELQNRIQQAVILSENRELSAQDLGFGASEDRRERCLDGVSGPSLSAGSGIASRPHSAALPPNGNGTDLWSRLQHHLVHHIEAATVGGGPILPLGRWLQDDLVLAADRQAGGVAARAAQLLGIPETTFRRRRTKASSLKEAGLAQRPDSWKGIDALLGRLVTDDNEDGQDLTEACQRLLLEAVLQEAPADVGTGASLLGVTPPTFRRRCAELEDAYVVDFARSAR